MPNIDVEFTMTDLSEMVKEATREAISTALTSVGVQAQARATQIITDNESIDTGNLRNSITFAIGIKGDELYVGTNVEYAPYVEFGHKQQKGRYVPAIGKRLVAGEVPAKPFLRPAIENYINEYKQIIENVLRQLNGN